MAQNNYFETMLPPYFLDLSYFYSTQFPNFPNGLACQMENPALYQYYSMWTPSIEAKTTDQLLFDKGEENHVAQQTSIGSRSLEIFEKPKRTQAPRFRPTKNNESNISNQAFSYATNENKSKSILQNFFKNKRKTQLFYDYSKSLNSNRKKYMSKGTLLKLCTLTEKSPELEHIIKLKSFNGLSLEEFVSGVRFLVLYFLKHKSTSSILTSQKIALNLKKDHINKVREILNYIEDSLETEKERIYHLSEAQPVKLQY